VLRSSLSNELKVVSGQVRQGVSIFFGCADREIRCPDSLGRKFRFSWVSGQLRQEVSVFLGVRTSH
jgi:hypothetical protein